jgi:hypothetical protein
MIDRLFKLFRGRNVAIGEFQTHLTSCIPPVAIEIFVNVLRNESIVLGDLGVATPLFTP